MGDIISTYAQQVVEARYAVGQTLANQSFSQATVLIQSLLAIANQAAGIDINTVIPDDTPDVPDAPPFAAFLLPGERGVPLATEAAIWQRGLDRSAAILADALGLIQMQYSGVCSLPFEVIQNLMVAEMDKYSYDQADIARDETAKYFYVGATFAKFIVDQMGKWSIATYEADLQNSVADAEFLLKRAEVQIRELISSTQLEVEADQGGAGIASRLGAAALTSVSADVSIHAGFNESDSTIDAESTSVGTSESTVTTNTDSNANTNTTGTVHIT